METKKLQNGKYLIDEKMIKKVFEYHAPKSDQIDRYMDLRQWAKEFAENIMSYCPPSRETSLALTKLGEVVMYANAAIARNE